MKIFIVNCGSSSIKYQLFEMADESVLAKGFLERIGTLPTGRQASEAVLHHIADGQQHNSPVEAPDHSAGLGLILKAITDSDVGVLADLDEIDCVGHRVVHGGEQIHHSTLIDDAIIAIVQSNAELAPLHNPPNLAGITAAMSALSKIPHVAVFDTAFLSDLPARAFRYAVPRDWYSKYHVRRYGFHGTSHRYVTLRAAELLGIDAEKVNLITVHLGNGCSMTAVAGGKAVDHSMGMTPLEGLVMGTRCGDIDPAVVFYMAKRAGLSLEDLDRILNKESGLLGVSGVSNDMRDCLAAADDGNADAALAVELFVYRIVKYIGAYFTVLPGCDAVVLTGGIGENSLPIRRRICQGLQRLGAEADEERNNSIVGGKAGPITTDDSSLPVWVIPTDEELMIARETQVVVERV